MLSYHNDPHPEWLSRLHDFFSKRLPDEESSQFAIDFLNAIPVGKNLEPVKWKFLSFLMNENINTILNLPDISDELRANVLNTIQQVLNLYQNALNTGYLDEVANNDTSAKTTDTWVAVEIFFWDPVWNAAKAAAVACTPSFWKWNTSNDSCRVTESTAYARATATRTDTKAVIQKYANELLDILKNHQ